MLARVQAQRPKRLENPPQRLWPVRYRGGVSPAVHCSRPQKTATSCVLPLCRAEAQPQLAFYSASIVFCVETLILTTAPFLHLCRFSVPPQITPDVYTSGTRTQSSHNIYHSLFICIRPFLHSRTHTDFCYRSAAMPQTLNAFSKPRGS